MLNIALFPNPLKKNAINLALEIIQYLQKKNIQVVASAETASSLNVPTLETIPPNEINFLISIGGDGTILKLVHSHPELTAPILGINLGGLGFFADVLQSDLKQSLNDLLQGHFKVFNRLVIEGETPDKQTFFAVNDVVFHRAKNPSLIDLSIEVDERYLNTFSADGLIISTPSGSTAYSLSAGGPIVTPDLQAVIITPICPHAISNRPIVLMPSSEIKIRFISEHQPIEIAYDGISGIILKTHDELTLKISNRKFPLVTLDRNEYYATLRTKLGWTGKLKQVQ